ncbi:unnamed protein product [Gadus morhua 'NCC']
MMHLTSPPAHRQCPQTGPRPGPYELRRSKTTDPSSHLACDVTNPGEEPARARVGGSASRSKEEREVHEELSRALARGLRLDLGGGSLQGSSGYSSQTPPPAQTPTPAQTPSRADHPLLAPGSDWDYFAMATDQEADPERSSRFHPKRPAPSSSSAPLGVATIRRAPSSKPSLRRPPGAPGPVRPPMIPVKTPTVPDRPFPPPTGPPTPRVPPAPAGPPAPPCPLPGPGADSPAPPPQQQGAPVPRGPERRPLPGLLEEAEQGEGVLASIRRGVPLRGGDTDDRSAPRTH